MNKQTKELRERILKLVDSHPKDGYREFLEELEEDIVARISCLDEEENAEITT